MKKISIMLVFTVAVASNVFAANYPDSVTALHTGTDFKSENMWMVMGQECPLNVFIKPDHETQTIKSTNWKVGIGKIGAGYNYGGWDDDGGWNSGFNLADMNNYAIKDNSGFLKSGESTVSYPEDQYNMRIFSSSDKIEVFVIPPKISLYGDRPCGLVGDNNGSGGNDNNGGGGNNGNNGNGNGGGDDGGTNPGNGNSGGGNDNGAGINADLYATAKSSCSGLGEQIDKIKIAAGISVGAGAVGTLAGGAAATAGLMKFAADKNNEQLTVNNVTSAGQSTETKESFKDKIVGAAPAIQTTGSFIAGGAAATGSISSFIGAGLLDDIIKNMKDCTEAVKALEKKKMELVFESPGNPDIEKFGKVVDNCRGLNVENIENIKTKMVASGVFSAVGAAAGVVGGVASKIANKEPDQPDNAESVERTDGGATKTNPDNAKNWGTASNVLSTASAMTSLISTIVSGITLSGLNKNSNIADKCKEAF